MTPFLDEKEKRYIERFGNPATIAHDVSKDPHVDVYVFINPDVNEYIYLTKGLEEAGHRELIMVTEDLQKWPVYFLQALTAYVLVENKDFHEMETYDNVMPVLEANSFNKALFLSTSFVGLDPSQMKDELGLNPPPLYVLPITESELNLALNSGAPALIEKFAHKVPVYGSVAREEVV